MEVKVIRSDRKTLSLQVREGLLIVRAPKKASKKSINDFLAKNKPWIEKQMSRAAEIKKMVADIKPLSEQEKKELVARAREVFEERASFYAKKLDVTYNRITVRFQRTRWGSCSAKGNLSFNGLLLFAPVEVLDSVVVHELCHLKLMNHSKGFYQEVLRAFPEYQKYHSWLKEHGDELVARIK